MHSSKKISTALLRAGLSAAVFAVPLVLVASPAYAQGTCDAYQVSCQTELPPDAPFSGSIFFTIDNLNGCPDQLLDPTRGIRPCTDSVTINPGMTIAQKCMTIVNQINGTGTSCANNSFTADGTNCATTGTFTVTDNICEGKPQNASSGLALMLGNSSSSYASTGFLPDYELDIVSNGCQSTSGASIAVIAGVPTGTAIVGNNASVTYAVATPDRGTAQFTVNITAGETAAAIASQAVSEMNGALSVIGSSVRCATDPMAPAAISCSVQTPASDGGSPPPPVVAAASSAPLSVAITAQLNDTGMKRFVMAGPAQAIQVARANIEAQGGIASVASVFQPPIVPAVGTWGPAGLFALLGATGLMLVTRRRRNEA